MVGIKKNLNCCQKVKLWRLEDLPEKLLMCFRQTVQSKHWQSVSQSQFFHCSWGLKHHNSKTVCPSWRFYTHTDGSVYSVIGLPFTQKTKHWICVRLHHQNATFSQSKSSLSHREKYKCGFLFQLYLLLIHLEKACAQQEMLHNLNHSFGTSTFNVQDRTN